MLTLGKDRRLGVGVEYTDFQLGYQIVDGRLMEYLEKRSHVNDEWTKETWGADAVEDSETDFTPKTLEERYHEEVSKLFLSVREFYPESTPMEFVVKGQKITRNFSQGKLLLDYIEQIVSSQNIAWATEADGKPNREDNKELSDDLRDELFVDIMKQVNLGTKLGQRYKELSGYWGDALPVRFSWAVQYFSKIFKDRGNDENLVQEFAPKFIKVIESKTNKKVSKEEGKLIWSLLGLINAGFNPRAPILHASFDSEDRDSFKAVCKIN